MAMKYLNIFPGKNGLSEYMSPATLILGESCPDYNLITKLKFGDYVQVHSGTDITNTMEARTVGAIALFPSGNAQRGWYFMSLSTGRKLHKYSWTKLPISTDVIDRVHHFAEKEGQPLISSVFKYEWMPGNKIVDNNDESSIDEDDYISDSDNSNDSDDSDDIDYDDEPPELVVAEDSDSDSDSDDKDDDNKDDDSNNEDDDIPPPLIHQAPNDVPSDEPDDAPDEPPAPDPLNEPSDAPSGNDEDDSPPINNILSSNQGADHTISSDQGAHNNTTSTNQGAETIIDNNIKECPSNSAYNL